MNDIEKAIDALNMDNALMEFDPDTGEERPIEYQNELNQEVHKANLLAISALEKQISIKEVIKQLRENKINCKNSSTIYDTKDYVLLDKAIEIVKGDWRVEE